jgi:hypothetical protein
LQGSAGESLRNKSLSFQFVPDKAGSFGPAFC